MNKSSSVLINRRANRTVFANIVEQKKAVADGKQLRVTYITDNTNSVLVSAEDGAVETTVAEYTRYIDPSAQAQGPSLPDPPTGFAATSASGEVILTFTPGADGGSPITNYMYSLDNGTSYSAFSPATGPITGLTISGLTNGRTYSIKLLAVNSIGESTIGSDTVYITPLPGSALRLFLDGAFIVDPSGATWPDTSGKGKNATLVNSPVRSTDNSGAYVFDGVNDYATVPSGFADVSAGITVLTFANFGASKDTWERLIDFGTGEQENNILFARAGTSSNLVFQIYNGSSLSFSEDISGGIIENGWGFYVARLDGSRYLVKNQNADASGASTVLPVAVNRTSNYIGKSNWGGDDAFEGRIGLMAIYGSALTDAEIAQFFDLYKSRYFTVPAAPTSLIATAGDGQVSVAFTAGATGGCAITNYQYSTDGGTTYSAFSPATVASPVVITGLTNGTSYSIRLRAVNSMGAGAASAAVSSTPVAPIPTENVYTSPTNIDVDISAASPFTGGGYAYEFNGTYDYPEYLTVSGDNSWAFGTGAFTIEWFQYQTDNNDFPRIFATATDSIGCSIESGILYPWLNGEYPISVDVNDITPDDYKNKWIHFAIVRDSNGTLNVYKDGNSLGSGSDTTNITDNTSTLFIGVQNTTTTANTWFGGYLTNIRIVKGLAVYTGPFTVPTSALTLTASANPYGGSNTAAIPAGFTRLLLVPTIQTFATVGTTSWTAPEGITSVEYLVVGGGGGGGGSYDTGYGGGGGGGLALYGKNYSVTPGNTYTIVVGDGGTGGVGAGNGGGDGTSNSGDSSQFDTIIASGGGAGGGSLTDRRGLGGNQGNAGTLTAPTGGGGGRSTGPTIYYNTFGAGGGGGMGSAGATATSSTNAAAGGSGISYSISGTSVTYSAGGSGGLRNTNINGTDGTANTGNGGEGSGSGSGDGSTGGKGGSGIVIIKY